MTSPAPESTENGADPMLPALRSAPGWPVLIAVIVVFGVGLLWLWQQVRDRDPGAAERAGQSQQLNTLTQRVEELAKIPTFADPAKVEQLAVATADLAKRTSENAAGVAAIGEQVAVRVTTVDARLSSQADKQKALDELQASSTAALSKRLDSADQGIASIGNDVGAVRQQLAETGQKLAALTGVQAQDVAAIKDRLTALDGQVEGLGQRVGKIESWVKRAQPARVAEQLVALAELRRLIDAGGAFTGPLKRVQASVTEAATLTTDSGWPTYAAKGIPTAAALSQSLAAIQRNHRQSSTIDTGSEWVDGAFNSLLKGVRIDKKPVLGVDPIADGLRAAQQALAAGDLAAADAAVAPIAEQVPPVVEWRKALSARRDATAAIAAWDQSVLAGISEASQ